MAKNNRRRLPSKKGRPRTKGERYANGRLKPSGPSQELVIQRQALCADPKMSTNPLDCAFANGWLTEKEHRIGRQYASIYNQCGFRIGSVSASAGQEVDIESEITKLSLSQMSDRMICDAWDNVMARPIKFGLDHDGSLLERWNAVNRPLSAVQRQQVYLVCIMDSWPQWIIQRQHAKTLEAEYEAKAKAERRALTEDELAKVFKHKHSTWERSRDHLIAGLKIIGFALAKPAQDPGIAASAVIPLPKAHSRKRAESTRYVDEEGNLIREVVRLIPVDTAC